MSSGRDPVDCAFDSDENAFDVEHFGGRDPVDRRSSHVLTNCSHGMAAHNKDGCLHCECVTPGFGHPTEAERDGWSRRNPVDVSPATEAGHMHDLRIGAREYEIGLVRAWQVYCVICDQAGRIVLPEPVEQEAAALDVVLIQQADALVSAVHDAIYAEPFDRQKASDAVWKVHELLRARLASEKVESRG
jgi:hypothetical protein